MSFLKKVNSKVHSINSYVNKYIESNQFEKNLKESLNNRNYGVANSVLYDLSIATYDVNYYKRVVEEVFKSIQEKPEKWRRIYKGLRLCEYVMKNGCEYFICEVKQKEEFIKKLTYFTYLEELRDKGAGIREISANIIKMLKDNQFLENERKAAVNNRKVYTHIESTPVIRKKSFFSKRTERQNKLKHYKTDSYMKNELEQKHDIPLKSRSVFDEIVRERNLLHENMNPLNRYPQTITSRRNSFNSLSDSEVSSKHESYLSSSSSETDNIKGKNKYADKRKGKKQKKSRSKDKDKSNPSSRTSSASHIYSENSSSHTSSAASASSASSAVSSSSVTSSASSVSANSHSPRYDKSTNSSTSLSTSPSAHSSDRSNSYRDSSSKSSSSDSASSKAGSSKSGSSESASSESVSSKSASSKFTSSKSASSKSVSSKSVSSKSSASISSVSDVPDKLSDVSSSRESTNSLSARLNSNRSRKKQWRR